MKSVSETGHFKNVSNLEALISVCKGYGAKYNPSNPALSIANLETIHQQALAFMEEVKTNERAFNSFVNKRMDVFNPIKSLSTRIVNALESAGVTGETVKDARTINRKLQGQRAGKDTAEKPVPEDQEPPSDKKISVSQQSYDQQVENFTRLVKILETEPEYAPNETDLTVAANKAKLAEFRNANTNVINSSVDLTNSRIKRDNGLYNPLIGLVNTALAVKKYVKSVFKASSPEYKQVHSLNFKNMADKK